MYKRLTIISNLFTLLPDGTHPNGDIKRNGLRKTTSLYDAFDTTDSTAVRGGHMRNRNMYGRDDHTSSLGFTSAKGNNPWYSLLIKKKCFIMRSLDWLPQIQIPLRTLCNFFGNAKMPKEKHSLFGILKGDYKINILFQFTDFNSLYFILAKKCRAPKIVTQPWP